MAILDNGIQGKIRGKIGNNITYVRRGTNCVKSSAHHFKYRNSEKQKMNAQQLKGIMKVIQSMKTMLIQPSWNKHSMGISGANLFMKTNYDAFNEKGLIGDFSKFQLTIGDLPLPENIKIEKRDKEVLFSWDFDKISSLGMPDDTAFVFILYEADFPQFANYFELGQRREGKAVMDISEFDYTDKLYAYLYFKSYDSKMFSNSLFTEIELK